MSVISAFDGAARVFFDSSIAVDGFPGRIECAARWVFEAWAIYRDEQEENVEVAANQWADVLRTPAHSHRSELRRLFLGGLLPSRARVRFAG